MDIIIYTTPETLLHKQGQDGYQKYFWHLPRFPKDIKIKDRIHFATKGFIRGSFEIEKFNTLSQEIIWDIDSWQPEPGKVPCKHFQGFKFRS